MKLVINIPETLLYKDICENGYIYDEDNEDIAKIIKDGIPLPKGHGDLIDRDQILQGEHFMLLGDVKVGDKNFGEREIDMFPKQTIMSVKPVIEADKGE